MKTGFIYLIPLVTIIISCSQKTILSNNTLPDVAKGLTVYIDDSLYTFDTAYALLETAFYPDGFKFVRGKKDTLFSVEIIGTTSTNLGGNTTWAHFIQASVAFQYHEVMAGTYYHNGFGKDDTLCGVRYGNKRYEYFMPNKLDSNYNITINSIDAASVKGTFTARVDALLFMYPIDSAYCSKYGFNPKEQLMIKGAFNLPVKKRIIVHDKNEQHD